jgi:hypothetical protein
MSQEVSSSAKRRGRGWGLLYVVAVPVNIGVGAVNAAAGHPGKGIFNVLVGVCFAVMAYQTLSSSSKHRDLGEPQPQTHQSHRLHFGPSLENGRRNDCAGSRKPLRPTRRSWTALSCRAGAIPH